MQSPIIYPIIPNGCPPKPRIRQLGNRVSAFDQRGESEVPRDLTSTIKQMANDEPNLRQILKQLDAKDGLAVTKSTLETYTSALFHAFTSDAPPSTHSLAYLVLSKIVSNARPKPAQATTQLQQIATESLVSLFSAPIQSRLTSPDQNEIQVALAFFIALFQVDGQSASDIFVKDGIMESLMEASELFQGEKIDVAIAGLLSQASAHQTCRVIVSSPDVVAWLEVRVKSSVTPSVSASAAVALTKLSSAHSDDSTGGETTTQNYQTHDQKSLAQLMMSLIKNSLPQPAADTASGNLVEVSKAMIDAVESLAYLSMDPGIKEVLSRDEPFLKRLFSLIPAPRKHQTGPVPVVEIDVDVQPRRNNLALLYGIAVVIQNVTAYKPAMSEEESQVDRLRRMAKGGTTTGRLDEPMERDSHQILEDDSMVKFRCTRLIKAGVLPALIGLSSAIESEGIRRSVGKALLSIIEDKQYRGKIIQGGGAKALLNIIHFSLSSSNVGGSIRTSSVKNEQSAKDIQLELADLFAIQALAKLAITSSPLLLFGPDPTSSIDAIRPFSQLLRSSSATLLQKFEALMALTNLASLGPLISSRIAQKDLEVLSEVENLLLDDNGMIRRAATELLCNLISADSVWERYTGETPDNQTQQSESISPKAVASRIHILMALSDVDDIPTQLAASGALAMLTTSSRACQTFLEGVDDAPSRFLQVMVALVSLKDDRTSESGVRLQLIHRGVVCLRNMFQNVIPQSSSMVQLLENVKPVGIVANLVAVISSQEFRGEREVIVAAAQVLKWLDDHGVKV